MARTDGPLRAGALHRLAGRAANLLGALAAALLLAYALYQQHVVGLEPCHLCVLQRVAVIGLGVVFLLAAMHDPARTGARVYAALLAFIAAVGMAVAARHVWLQMQPEGSVPACGADLSFMLQVLPLKDVIAKVLKGGAECQKVDWHLLGLSMPAWVFIALGTLGGAGVWANWRWHRRTS